MSGFLGDDDITALGYAQKVQLVMTEFYKGFTLVVGDGKEVYAICNRGFGKRGSVRPATATGTSATAASSPHGWTPLP